MEDRKAEEFSSPLEGNDSSPNKFISWIQKFVAKLIKQYS